MSLNLLMQVFCALLAIGCLLVIRLSESERKRLDRGLFLGASTLLVIFAAFRPLGVGLDDAAYSTMLWDRICPTLDCGQWVQGDRDQLWYSLVGFLKSLYPHPSVVLWLSGLGLVLKLWVIDRLCQQRSLALLFYVACFYVIHDVTALRVSLAISIYLLGFYLLIQGRFRWGTGLLAINGLFHQQAFLAPLVLLGRWLILKPRSVQVFLVLPWLLLLLKLYPGDALLRGGMETDWGRRVVPMFFQGYEKYKLAGVYDHTRLWPVVAPPTLLLAAWLIPDLWERQRKLFQLVASSLILAALFLWGYAVVPDVQLRIWHFFLVPIVLLIGNAELTRWKMAGILALCAIYVLKYTLMHDLLLDPQYLIIKASPNGRIIVQPQGVPCGVECGFSITQGSTLVITAQPDPGYRLAEWGGRCEGAGLDCTFALNEASVVSARFVQTSSLIVSKSGLGTVVAMGHMTCGTGCEQRVDGGALLVDGGQQVTLKAKPDSGYRFAGWSGSCAGVDISCIITLDQDRSVEARFEPSEGNWNLEPPHSPPP